MDSETVRQRARKLPPFIAKNVISFHSLTVRKLRATPNYENMAADQSRSKAIPPAYHVGFEFGFACINHNFYARTRALVNPIQYFLIPLSAPEQINISSVDFNSLVKALYFVFFRKLFVSFSCLTQLKQFDFFKSISDFIIQLSRK